MFSKCAQNAYKKRIPAKRGNKSIYKNSNKKHKLIGKSMRLFHVGMILQASYLMYQTLHGKKKKTKLICVSL